MDPPDYSAYCPIRTNKTIHTFGFPSDVNGDQNIEIVVRRHCISLAVPAPDASVGNHPLPFPKLLRVRLHETAAGGSPIAWINVYVFAPQTVRAMIRVPIAPDFSSAVLAGKILNCSLELPHARRALLPPGTKEHT